MFGFLTLPCSCRTAADAELYRRYFCGLCDALSVDYGLPARWLINHDSTFIAVLTIAQMPQPTPITWSRHCRPFARPKLAVAGNRAFDYAAAITLCGMRIKLQDTRQDESSLVGLSCVLVALLSRGMFTKAHTVLAEFGFPISDVLYYLTGQSKLEAAIARGEVDPQRAIEPSAHALGTIFAYSAVIAGQPQPDPALYTVGHALGRIIYVLDSYQDQVEDRARGRFNFMAALGIDDVRTSRKAAAALITEDQRALCQAWPAVQAYRHQSLVEGVLLAGVPAKATKLLVDDDESREPLIHPTAPAWSVSSMRPDLDMTTDKSDQTWDGWMDDWTKVCKCCCDCLGSVDCGGC